MTLIYTAAQYSLRRERSREELVESLQKILRESQRTTALIDDLLLLARGDAGKERAALVPMDAAPLVRDAAEQATAMASARNIAVDLQLGAGALPVRADDAQLRRLLLILVDNALKYTPPGGRVSISGHADDTDVTIAVADTGTGIAPDDLPHVFERFWRADKVRSREAGGHGPRPDHREADRRPARRTARRGERARPRLGVLDPPAEGAGVTPLRDAPTTASAAAPAIARRATGRRHTRGPSPGTPGTRSSASAAAPRSTRTSATT